MYKKKIRKRDFAEGEFFFCVCSRRQTLVLCYTYPVSFPNTFVLYMYITSFDYVYYALSYYYPCVCCYIPLPTTVPITFRMLFLITLYIKAHIIFRITIPIHFPYHIFQNLLVSLFLFLYIVVAYDYDSYYFPIRVYAPIVSWRACERMSCTTMV